MNQTEFHQRLKQMRFTEAYDGYHSKRLSQSEAAALLGVCDRSFRRYMQQYDESGMDGLLDRRLNEPSARRAPLGGCLFWCCDLRFFELMFDAIGYSTPLSSRLPMANLWLLSPVVEQVLLSAPNSAATAHTTIAVTMLSGSEKSNVLPTQASAVVNFRILPGDSIATVVEHVRQAIDDPRVAIETFMGNEASPISSMNSYGFKLIESTIRGLDHEVLVTPYLVQGATDSSHFYGLSDNVYRFMMVRLNPVSMPRFHGINEQISIRDYLQAIQFYYAMVKQAAAGQTLK